MAERTLNTIPLTMPFGMPPENWVDASNDMMKDTMPTATIQPCEPEFNNSLSLFRLAPSNTKYSRMLADHGFTIDRLPIEVAYLADNFPTDTFNNEYGETFLDKFSQVASGGLSDFAQILGTRNALGAVDVIKGLAGSNAVTSRLFGMAESGVNTITSGLKKMAENTGNERAAAVAGSMLKTAGAIAAGARVDFPQVWKNSGFSPSYTMTIRLYNPAPGDPTMTKKYIVGPLAALLLLGLPQAGTTDGATYQWPFLCKVRSKGIYHLNSAYINSISVIKGGDQQNIGWNQSLGIVDVRIDFGSLYGSMLAETSNKSKMTDSRPTLKTYLEGIGGSGTEVYGKRKIYSYPEKRDIIDTEKDIAALKRAAKQSVKETQSASDAADERIQIDALTSSDTLVSSANDTTKVFLDVSV